MKYLILIAALFLSACAAATPTAAPPTNTPEPINRQVIYRVTGDGTWSASVTYKKPDGATEQADIELPWETQLMASSGFLYVSAQNANEFGSITCEIVTGSQTLSEATSEGAYKIATCEHLLR
jgi:hypothetical protein